MTGSSPTSQPTRDLPMCKRDFREFVDTLSKEKPQILCPVHGWAKKVRGDPYGTCWQCVKEFQEEDESVRDGGK